MWCLIVCLCLCGVTEEKGREIGRCLCGVTEEKGREIGRCLCGVTEEKGKCTIKQQRPEAGRPLSTSLHAAAQWSKVPGLVSISVSVH